MSKPTEKPEVTEAQDAAWNIKDALDDLHPRYLSTKDKAQLGSITRDLGRIHGRVVAMRDKRKRGSEAPEPTPDAQTDLPVQE